jgi:hypothetical protein
LGELASECETERARMLTAKYRPDDSITLTKGLPITVRRLSGDRLALSVTCGDTSPKGGNNFDRRQWRKQEEIVGAAASRMQARAQQTLGAATRVRSTIGRPVNFV